jgi:hypothetical protein
MFFPAAQPAASGKGDRMIQERAFIQVHFPAHEDSPAQASNTGLQGSVQEKADFPVMALG